MAGLSLLETNPILRHVLDDLPDQSPRAHALVARIERGRRGLFPCRQVGRYRPVSILGFDEGFDRSPVLIREEPGG